MASAPRKWREFVCTCPGANGDLVTIHTNVMSCGVDMYIKKTYFNHRTIVSHEYQNSRAFKWLVDSGDVLFSRINWPWSRSLCIYESLIDSWNWVRVCCTTCVSEHISLSLRLKESTESTNNTHFRSVLQMINFFLTLIFTLLFDGLSLMINFVLKLEPEKCDNNESLSHSLAHLLFHDEGDISQFSIIYFKAYVFLHVRDSNKPTSQ